MEGKIRIKVSHWSNVSFCFVCVEIFVKRFSLVCNLFCCFVFIELCIFESVFLTVVKTKTPCTKYRVNLFQNTNCLNQKSQWKKINSIWGILNKSGRCILSLLVLVIIFECLMCGIYRCKTFWYFWFFGVKDEKVVMCEKRKTQNIFMYCFAKKSKQKFWEFLLRSCGKNISWTSLQIKVRNGKNW